MEISVADKLAAHAKGLKIKIIYLGLTCIGWCYSWH